MELKIDPDFKSVLPELANEEYTELERDIVKNGVLSPIVVWNGTIVDGHNRYAICQAHRIENFPTKDMEFGSREDALEWILRNQLGRRNLNDFQRNRIALRYEEVIKEKMKKRQGARNDLKHSGPPDQNVKSEPASTREEIAKIAGTSEASVARTKRILEHGTPEQIARAEAGGKGNGLRAITDEIREAQTEPKTRMCHGCGRELPLSGFYKGRSTCKECDNSRRRASAIKDIKGNPMRIPPEIRGVTECEIVGDLYNTDKAIVFTVDDFAEEFGALIKNFSESAQRCLDMHKELLTDKESKDKVLGELSLLQTEILSWKETYQYE